MRVRGNPKAQVVQIGARLDAGTSAGIRSLLHDAVDSGEGDLILDLSELEMIDATGLGVLVGTHRRASAGQRRLVLRGVPPRIMRILAVTRLNRVLRVEAQEAAVA
ncbi:STAS domain-containing protein [Nonomuraea roseoviolacea subsp. roseoviolacea]|uniref:Anti-sigma factor antagonist n=1 Tax=Nonomuraea roseoviolacea subsp. carminata TaxID=160689 RepID=A0ABT1JUF8_9ACTN|nr:STAS domain-containing protein [Nonomuraea roseoviolacea]MCP2345375.1 anti-anti-sigma factor [Nonomuraea roseoviolacea subsp. carminata]